MRRGQRIVRSGAPRHRGRRGILVLATVGMIAAVGCGILLLPDSGSTAPQAARGPVAGPVSPEADLAFKQAVVMLHAKQYEHAATALHRVLALAPAMPEAHVNMGYAMLGMKRPAIARDFFRDAIALRPGQANAHYGLAEALADLGDREGAIGAMRAYLSLARADDPFVAKAKAAIEDWQGASTVAAIGRP